MLRLSDGRFLVRNNCSLLPSCFNLIPWCLPVARRCVAWLDSSSAEGRLRPPQSGEGRSHPNYFATACLRRRGTPPRPRAYGRADQAESRKTDGFLTFSSRPCSFDAEWG
jgi:hypothetical protein